MPETPEMPEELPLADEAAVVDEATVSAPESKTPETTSVSETTKEQDPMLDVHPANHAASTWRDFFIHIATIVLGLLIAVGLEQTVEYFHHGHQRDDAREQLVEEIKQNAEITKDNVYSLHRHEKHLAEALQVLGRLRTHTLLPTDHIITERAWIPVRVATWKTARADGAASYLPTDEQAFFELANWDAEQFNIISTEASVALGRGAIVIHQSRIFKPAPPPQADAREIYFGHRGDAAAEELSLARQAVGAEVLTQLTAAQIDRLEQVIESSLYDDENLLNACTHLTSFADRLTQPTSGK
jgi:hypothetical protein